MYKKGIVLFCLIIVLAGCASVPEVQISGSAVVHETVNTASTDYLPPGVKIAALRLVSWEDTIFMAQAYPVNIIQQASGTTEHKYLIEPVIAVEGSKNQENDLWKWTRWVFNSRPAKIEDLVVGTLVLVVDRDVALSNQELSQVAWKVRTITNMSKLYQNLVEVGFYDTYYHLEKTHLVHSSNIRIILDISDQDHSW